MDKYAYMQCEMNLRIDSFVFGDSYPCQGAVFFKEFKEYKEFKEAL